MNKKLDYILSGVGLLVIVLIILGLFSNAFAGGFTFGSTTYEQADDILIVNSLGDQISLSTFNKLGTNDFIQESAVKNYLVLEGYTQANDYNPSVTNPQFPEYGVKPDDNMTKLTFAGLLGDPRAEQDVYVLTKEYDRLSAPGQANSIDNLNSGLYSETTNRINGDSLLQTNINTVNNNSVNRDNVLQTNINTEATTRSNADNTLQNNINVADNNSQTRDNKLQTNINSANSRIDDVSNRVGKLEKTQVIAELGVRILDTKHLTVVPYIQQNFTRSTMSEIGIRVVVKMGKSYEEKLIENTNLRIKAIETKLGVAPVITKVVNEKGKIISIQIEENGLSLNGEF
jgi:hypothetical protein